MPKSTEDGTIRKKRAEPGGKARGGRQSDAAERPPESAEDFGHVLRRLISPRSGQPSERGGTRRGS